MFITNPKQKGEMMSPALAKSRQFLGVLLIVNSGKSQLSFNHLLGKVNRYKNMINRRKEKDKTTQKKKEKEDMGKHK